MTGSCESPTLRERTVARLSRLYPFLSGRGFLAGCRPARFFLPIEQRVVWAPTPGGNVCAPLDDHVGRSVFLFGDLDRKISALCTALVRPGDLALDIGANLGLVTMLLSRLVGPAGRVLAFEPNPRLASLISAALRSNDRANVRLHEVALGARDEVLTLSVPSWNMGMGTLNPDAGERSERIAVPVVRLDTLLAQEGCGQVRLVKIDVEGWEGQVLEGARCLFEKRPPEAVIFECNGDDEGTMARELVNLGYALFAIPRALLRLRLIPWRPGESLGTAHDVLALHRGSPSTRQPLRRYIVGEA